MSSTNGVQKGFFKRLLNTINTKRYERNKTNQEKYLVSWNKVKWRYRFGKLFVLFTFYYGGMQFFYNKNLDFDLIKREAEEIKNELKNILTYLNKFDDADYFEQLKTACKSLKQYFASHLIKADQITIGENKEYEFLIDLTKSIVEALHNKKDLMKQNENFKFLDLESTEEEFNFNNFLSKIIIAEIKKKYNKEDIPKGLENAILLAEQLYKQLICTSFPKNNLIISTNLIDELPNAEHVAFAVALNLIDYYGAINMKKPIEDNFNEFFEKIVNKNFHYFKGKYKEDIQLIIKDLKRTKDIKTFVIVNPLLCLNFTREIEELKEALVEKQTEINIIKISLALELLRNAGFDLTKLSNFTFDNIYYQILDIHDQENNMKNTIEKYLRKKVTELSKIKSSCSIEDVKNYESINAKWTKIKSLL